MTGRIVVYRHNDFGISGAAEIFASRGWDTAVRYSLWQQSGYYDLSLVTLSDGGKNWVALLYDAHTGSSVTEWQVDLEVYSADDSKISLQPLYSTIAIHSAISGGTAPRMAIPYGNVGIGTATPSATLEVNGTAKFDNTVTFASGQVFTGNGSGLTNLNPANLTSGTAAISITGNAATATSAITAGTATNSLNLNGVAGTSYARLDTANTFSANQTINGNVGIQTTPTNRLVVLGPANQAAAKGIGVGTSTRGASQFGSTTAGLWGDTNRTSGTGVGVAASADTSSALIAVNNQSAAPPGPWYPTIIAYNSGSNGVALSVGGDHPLAAFSIRMAGTSVPASSPPEYHSATVVRFCYTRLNRPSSGSKTSVREHSQEVRRSSPSTPCLLKL